MSVAVDGDIQALPIFQDTTNVALATDQFTNGDLTNGVFSKDLVAEENHSGKGQRVTSDTEEVAEEVASDEEDVVLAKENGVVHEDDVAVEVAESKAHGDDSVDARKVVDDQGAESPNGDATNAYTLNGIADEPNGHAPFSDVIVEEETTAAVALDVQEEPESVDATLAPPEEAEVEDATEPTEAPVVLEESSASEDISIAIEEPSVSDTVAEEFNFAAGTEEANVEVVAGEPTVAEPEAVAEEPTVTEPEVVAEEPTVVEPEVVAEESTAVEPEVVAEETAVAEPEVVAEEPTAAEPVLPTPEEDAVFEASPAAVEASEDIVEDAPVEETIVEPVETIEEAPVVEETAPATTIEEESVVEAVAEPEVELETPVEAIDVEAEEPIAVEAPEATVVEEVAAVEVPAPEELAEVEVPIVDVALEVEPEAAVAVEEAAELTPDAPAESDAVPEEAIASTEEVTVAEEETQEDVAVVSEEVLEETSPSVPATETRADSMAVTTAPEPVEEAAIAEEVLVDEATNVPPAEESVQLVAEEDVAPDPAAEESTEIVADVLAETPADAAEDASIEVSAGAPEESTPAPIVEVVETTSAEHVAAVEETASEDVIETQETPDVVPEPEVTEADSTDDAPAVDIMEATEPETALEDATESSEDVLPVEELAVAETAEAEEVVQASTESETAVAEEVVESDEIPTTEVTVAEDEETEETPVISINTDDGGSETLIATHEAEERPKSPWTPSYSVTTQGPGTADPPADDDEIAELEPLPPSMASDEPTVSEIVVEAEAEEEVAEAEPEVEAPAEVIVTEADVEEPVLEAPADAIEPPKSPSWIPSYSVNSQGPSPLPSPQVQPTEESQLEEVDSISVLELSTAAVSAAEDVEDVGPIPETMPEIVVEADTEEVETFETVETEVETPAEAVIAEDTAEQQVIETPADAEPPKSPSSWIPSYSVNSQGPSPLPSPKVQATEEGQLEVPTFESGPDAVDDTEESTPEATPEVVVEQAAATEEVEDAHSEEPTSVEPELEAELAAAIAVTEVASEVLATEASKSSSWIPSYSVSSQGASPLPSPKLEATEVLETEVEPVPALELTESANTAEGSPFTDDAAVDVDVPEVTVTTEDEVETVDDARAFSDDEVAPPPTISTTDAEASETVGDIAPAETQSGWIPSYSVNSQGTSPVHAPHVTEDVDVEKLEPLTADAEIERPKSPWIPSYSISQQGASPIHTPVIGEDKELGQLEQLPAPATTESDVEAVVSEEVVEFSEVQPSIVVEDAAEAAPEADTSIVTEDRPERPWTPSYSVSRQGPGTPNEAVAEEESAQEIISNGHDSEAFPSTEDTLTDLKKIATKPSLVRLAAVNEDEQATLAAPRARLESTTSSRFFPGGWFSSAPNEGRPSVETAEGEFSKSSMSSPALDIPLNAAVEDADARKRRWCYIISIIVLLLACIPQLL